MQGVCVIGVVKSAVKCVDGSIQFGSRSIGKTKDVSLFHCCLADTETKVIASSCVVGQIIRRDIDDDPLIEITGIDDRTVDFAGTDEYDIVGQKLIGAALDTVGDVTA